jgi:hypothetical protein
MTMTEYNSRDPYGEAVDSLVDDVAFAKAEREGRVEYVDDEPADDPTAWEATHHEPDAGHQYDDTGQAGDGFTADDAAGFLADVRDNWHSLDPADQQEASELAGALLAELGADFAPRATTTPSSTRPSPIPAATCMRPWPLWGRWVKHTSHEAHGRVDRAAGIVGQCCCQR